MLRELIKLNDKKLIKEYIEDIHAFDLSIIFNELSEEERELVYKHIEDEKLAELVTYLDPDFAAEILAEFDLEKQKRLVEMMEPDDAADIIMELEIEEKDDLLEILGNDSDISKLISYDESETGSAMTNLFISVHPDMDVKKATKKVIKEAREVESINTIFVTDEHGVFLGAVPLKKLLKAKTPLEISEIIEEFPFTYDKTPIEQTVQSIRNYAIYEMPVLNEKNELVGMITLDDALDIYKEEAKEDFEKLAGLPETSEDATIIKTALHRIPWLLTLLLIMIPVSLVTHSFEYTLSQVAILIVFQPLILDSAGNVATQTLAVTLRMFSTNEKGLFKNSYREILAGMMNGFVIGFIAFVMTLLFGSINSSLASNSLLIAFVVGISLWITVIIAPIVSILIPLTLRSLKFDPAVASGPFITTIIDVAAIVIYFGLAILMGVTG
jgi:magnesium transporter